MVYKTIDLLESIYSEHLKLINGVKLTRREIDIIAFFICGRSAKKIASFFSISPKTVENHTHNIMLKLGCHSRESIIDFIEQSDKLLILRKYYTTALTVAVFEQCLKDIAKLTRSESLSCSLVRYGNNPSQDLLINHLDSSLNLAGLKVSAEVFGKSHSLEDLNKESYVIYMLPQNAGEISKNKEYLSSFPKNKSRTLLLVTEGYDQKEISKSVEGVNCLSLEDSDNFYFFVFDILKKIFPNLKLDPIIFEFKKQCISIEGVEDSQSPQAFAKEPVLSENTTHFLCYIKEIFLNKKGYFFVSCLATILGLSIFYFGGSYLQNGVISHRYSIRSELILPTESVHLRRPDLIAQIEERFRGWSGVHTIALVGVGGAGKTTLANTYGNSQKSPVVWVIDAETKETLNDSFEELAEALARTEVDKKIFRGLLKNKSAMKREENLIQFVKERLWLNSNWFLIFDNVVKFTDIQKHFPRDPAKWGQGRILLTTQDSNIENNKHVSNAIQVGTLNPEQKLNLFMKIMTNGGSSSFTPKQIEEAKKFLVEIPPFPLDVSMAAYYLKATNIPYKNYLQAMLKYNKDFSSVQEKILQEAGNYTKTRYGIITLSVKHLIDTNKNFRDLLFFISLLDTQYIPRDLLVQFNNNTSVDNFIYNLKKYSLITNETSPPDRLDSVFSIHRSTQEIILAYLQKTLTLEESGGLIARAAQTLETYMSETLVQEDFSNMKILYRHVEEFLAHDKLLSDSIIGSLEGELGCFFYYLRYPTKAKKLLEDGLAKLQKASDKNHNKIGHFLVYLGNVHRNLGEYETAKKLFEKSLNIYNQHGENSVGVARASGYLGAVYRALGDFEKAKAFLERSLVIYNAYPDNHIGRAWSLAHLGSIYTSLGEYKKAKNFFASSRLLYKKYSENHVGAAWVSGDLGDTYLKLGNFKKAKKFIEECLKICNEHFCEDHVYVAEALVHLGILYREQGDFEKAKSLFKKGLVSFEATYGREHAETGSVLMELGILYVLEDNFRMATQVLNKALHIFQKSKHPDQYIVLENLAKLHHQKYVQETKKGNLQRTQQLKTQATSFLNQALKIVKAHFPEGSPHIQRLQSRLNEANAEAF